MVTSNIILVGTILLLSILLEVTHALPHIGVLFYIQAFVPIKFLVPLPGLGIFTNIGKK